MNLHQVLTGAVNPGDNCFSVGSLLGQPLTAYASGCDIVILGTDFERLQIIPGAKHGNIQVGCVDCSMQQGKIAASYGNMICIFDPVTILKQKSNHPAGIYYQWQKSGQILLDSIAHNITWDPTGTRLLTGSSCLQLWSNINLENQSEDGNPEKTDVSFGDWQRIWQCKMASQVHLMKFSPDGEFFATAGKDDCLVKVWYNTDSWRSAVTPQSSSPQKQSQDVDFSFVYLAHPRSVNGFSWRKTSKYMPSGAVCNVLLTCCKDNVCRLWAETLLPNDSLSCAGGYNHWTEPVNLTNNFKRNASSKERMQNALELNLKPFRRGRRRSLTLIAHTGYSPHQQDPHEVHRNTPLHANALCHFHIAASINPATDIPLLPSITSLSLSENEEKSGPFVVHWLNNKELHFTLSMEVFLQQLKKSFEPHSSETSTEESNQLDGKSDEEADDNGEDQKGNQEKKEQGSEKNIPNSGLVPLSSAVIDHEIEILLSEWSKNADMLFSIHPMDGSLLVWHVDWLDEYQPGMFRQVQVSFVSRIPVAFPTGDANSLCRSIVMYACTKNVDLAIQQGKQKPIGLTRSSSMLICAGHSKSTNSLKLSIFTPNVMMISKHADGSLNQWLVSFAEESAFSTVLSISHKSRYCGHRFHLNDLACHSVLPLLLTTSHHNALSSPDDDSTKQNDASTTGESSLRSQNRDTTSVTSQDPNAVYSELILWRVDPVGPLSFSGGVSELARINSLHVSAFSNVAWLPTLIPSYCLGAYCNSPSACFVASDGQYLRLYQAIIDAKKLLCELSNPEISKYVGEVFNIISQQSTARPGCIVELDAITELHGRKTQLLHVFQENFILNNHEAKTPEKNCLEDSGQLQNGFSEKFYLIVIEYAQNCSLLHMWNLHLKSIPVSVDEKIDSNISEGVSHQEELYSSSPDREKIQSPFTHKYRACRANLQSTSRLTLSSEMVYSQELNLPDGVEIISVKPSAGHLSSSSMYPVCQAPYLLATSCSDGKVRFWRCKVTPESVAASTPEYTVNSNVTYIWEEWPLLVEDRLLSSSAVSVPGRPIEVSCAHTNRLAVAYKQTTSKNSRCSQDFMMHVGIFECESTGGSCWILEQTLHLDEISTMLDSAISIDSNLMAYNKQEMSNSEGTLPSIKHLVHLDWMSREDGSHILTVGIGSKLYMFGQLAGNMHDQTNKEISPLPWWENAKVTSLCKFVLLRCVDLVSSVEGSPPLPVSLSWVRDGILVVGMDCEMHVYSQWQPPSKQELVTTDSYSGSTPSITSLMKQSQSTGSGLHPPKRSLTRSMTSLAQKLSGKRTAFDLSVEMEDSGLFEAAHALCPTLPQYHPFQLLELMDLGKVHRAKAILSHLVKCIAGEVVAVNESEPNPDRRLRSLTISASGSTARDPRTFNKTENTDYTEIDSVPPLPLYALLAADDDCSHVYSEKPNNQNNLNKQNGISDENYENLFQNSSLSTDDLTVFEAEEDNTKPKVIDLSQYSPTYFGPEHAQVLSRHLLHSSLPGLTRMEQMSLMALADTIATTSTDIGESRDRNQGGETLDECGLKFLLAVQLHTFLTTSLPPVHRAQLLHQGLSTRHFAWAFHSVAEEELLSMLPAVQKGDPTWSELRAMGVGWWVRNIHSLRRCIEKVAKAAFQRNNDPLDAAIFYLAMKKKAVIWGLYRSQKETKMTQFFGNNFTEDRWRKAALKNAFSLLGKQRFEHSAAFFLLAGHLKDAVEVCLEKLGDIQLALVISRLYESEFEVSSTYKSILQKRILGGAYLGKESSSTMHCDPFLRSMAFWILEDYSRALDTLIKQPAGNEDENGASPSCDPAVFNFYNYLRTHPLLLRRHFGSSETSSTRICLTVENGLSDKINLSERRLFFTTAHAHLKAGCPMLALEVLSKMPKVVKKSKPFGMNSSFMDVSKDFSPSSPIKLDTKEDKASIVDWSQPVLNGLGSSSDCSSDKQSSSALSFDWSQPSLIFQDEPLELKWDSDKDEESEDSPLVMKDLKPLQKLTIEKLDETSSNYSESFSAMDENNVLSPSEDVISAQLKFRACLKILTVELRTLSTGYEVDGGKLRYQLYHWLEREVIALQKTCDYSAEIEEVQPGISMSGEIALSDNIEDLSDQQKAMLQRENFQRRRQWLLKYQSLLRMFLSYCILHGSHGGGLASVRMELILLLQESQQEQSIQTLPSPLPEQNSIPLLFACTASAKTVVASPLLHLSNLTHDILHTVINLDSPPHPDIQNNKIHVMHTLAASLSACIYQCLCGGPSYSSLQANQFTGTVYQTLLLTQRPTLRTTSLDETVTPNTSPTQWPGITALIRLLNSAGEEAQPGLTVLLCEILTAVYLSLFIHGLATHSSSELYRIMTHPFNDKMWSAIFGGGAHIPRKGQMQQRTKTVSSSVDNGKKQQRSCTLLSKISPKESSQSPSSEEQESPSYREKFIPPELSIWDYFIAKPFLPSSQSRIEYDSEESQGSDDEDDAFASDSHLQEHSNSNSYSWSLMRLAMVQLVLHRLKNFYPLAGHDLSELPVSSPLCHGILKTFQRWEQVLLRRLEIHGGPPQNLISAHTSEDALSAGPALLRHKALLEPTNTPFNSNSHVALSVKRLWQYLVKQEEVQETFIRNIFTKKRCLNESLEDHSETIKNTMMEEPIFNKVESDLEHPGGKARIIHKESDIITAFAVNKANRNCIAIASSHDIQELDVSGILATQIYTWVDDDTEVEAKGSDDFLVIHARDDLANVQGTTPYTHSNPGTPINMPWLGSTQTGRGASVLIKKTINNVRRMASHPSLPYYLTGAQDGSVRMFEWGHSQQITCFRSAGNTRITRMRFNHQGNKFGIVDADGYICLYQTNWKCCPLTGSTPKPYLTWQCHNKTANDFVFISSSSLIATAGQATDNRNICLWDTLVAPANSLVHAFICHDSGATVLAYAPKHQLLISGGRKGFTCIIDLRQKQQRQLFQSHDSPVKAIAVDPAEEYFVTGSAEGNIKVWSLSTFNLLHTFINEHARQSIFRNIGTGVMQIETGPANHIFSCGADGTVKMRILPDQFSPLNELLKSEVKFML
ncbi:dmX-like protein 1 isoform X3 [Pelodiscus sinensis]|uniref:dmX-like protein 1 isoform X3 n=1 Tax=Pelodiscus sinensis TaxID=13735 RepID=UPI0003C42F85|nr:dmX-like protein 1 isoform X1 [Pelodiscus sinensis]|eukprot:XP_006134554.1 dmX-like protein 1 isoform X1 [Pelodiscus sinensis]